MAVSHVKSNTIADWTGTVTVGNSTGGTQTVAATDMVRPSDWNSGHNQFYTLSGNTNNASTASGTNVVLQGLGAVTLVGSTGTIGISCAPPVTHSSFHPYIGREVVAGQVGNATMAFFPFQVPMAAYQHDRMVLPILFTGATNSTGSMTASVSVGLYTKNGSTLSLLTSGSGTVGITHSGTANSTLNSGSRIATFGMTGTVTAGDYIMGFWSRTTSGGANMTLQQYIISAQASTFSGLIGVATNASRQPILGAGQYSVTFSTAMPDSVGYSQLLGSNSAALRYPSFYFASGTV